MGRHSYTIEDIAFSPDGTILASVGGDVRLWQVSDGTLLDMTRVPAQKVAFSPDGSPLAIAVDKCAIYLWDVEGQ